MIAAPDAVLEVLDKEACAVSLTGLVAMLPDYQSFEVKDAVGELFDAGRIYRIPTMGPNKRYYTYLSLHVQTTTTLTPEQAATLITRLEQDLAPESECVDVVRPVPMVERRSARYGIMDVIDRWKLGFRLSRIIEIVGSARNRKLTREDAAVVIRMIREHVRGVQ